MHSRLAGVLAAELLVDEGRLGEARALLTGELRIRSTDRIGHRLQARVAATKLALAESDDAAARRTIRRGTQEIAAHQAIFGSVDLRTAAAVHGRRLAALDLDIALAGGRPARVFEAVERARATSSRLPPIRPPADDRGRRAGGRAALHRRAGSGSCGRGRCDRPSPRRTGNADRRTGVVPVRGPRPGVLGLVGHRSRPGRGSPRDGARAAATARPQRHRDGGVRAFGAPAVRGRPGCRTVSPGRPGTRNASTRTHHPGAGGPRRAGRPSPPARAAGDHPPNAGQRPGGAGSRGGRPAGAHE